MAAMAEEMEIKVKVDRHEPVRRRLRSAGAVYLGTVIHTDLYFDTPGRDLLNGESGLRLRVPRLLRRGDAERDLRAVLTFKGPLRPHEHFKVREETQTHLDSPEVMRDILKSIGLVEQLSLEKKRASYTLGRCLVELDEIPMIGCFVEVEASREGDIHHARKVLALTGEPLFESYVRMAVAEAERRGLDPARITFRGHGGER